MGEGERVPGAPGQGVWTQDGPSPAFHPPSTRFLLGATMEVFPQTDVPLPPDPKTPGLSCPNICQSSAFAKKAIRFTLVPNKYKWHQRKDRRPGQKGGLGDPCCQETVSLLLKYAQHWLGGVVGFCFLFFRERACFASRWR